MCTYCTTVTLTTTIQPLLQLRTYSHMNNKRCGDNNSTKLSGTRALAAIAETHSKTTTGASCRSSSKQQGLSNNFDNKSQQGRSKLKAVIFCVNAACLRWSLAATSNHKQ